MIKKDMMIAEVAEKYPDTVKVLLDHGLHCIGCHAAHNENLEQGCKAHGLDDKEIDEMVEEMNKILENN